MTRGEGGDVMADTGTGETVRVTDVIDVTWEPRRVAAVEPLLPDGVTPPGTRGRILQAALRLFAAAGFAGTSIRQIGAAAGINSATLYAHFTAKEQILAELIRIGHEELHARLEEAAGSADPADHAGRVAAIVRAHVGLHADYPLLATVANTELHALSPQLVAGALRLRARSRQLLIAAIRDGAKAGAFDLADADDVILTATAIGAIGMRVAQWFGPDQPFSRDKVADHHAWLALRMLGAYRKDRP